MLVAGLVVQRQMRMKMQCQNAPGPFLLFLSITACRSYLDRMESSSLRHNIVSYVVIYPSLPKRGWRRDRVEDAGEGEGEGEG